MAAIKDGKVDRNELFNIYKATGMDFMQLFGQTPLTKAEQSAANQKAAEAKQTAAQKAQDAGRQSLGYCSAWRWDGGDSTDYSNPDNWRLRDSNNGTDGAWATNLYHEYFDSGYTPDVQNTYFMNGVPLTLDDITYKQMAAFRNAYM